MFGWIFKMFPTKGVLNNVSIVWLFPYAPHLSEKGRKMV
jgi:hypothetical protein